MKTLKIALTALLFTGLWSCTDDDNFMLVQQQGDFELLTPDSGTSVVLTSELENNPAISFAWSQAQYSTPTEVTYQVQLLKEGGNWDTDEFYSTSPTTTLSKSLTVSELNTIALSQDLAFDTPGNLQVRVKASIGNSGSDAMYSNTIVLNVTPYAPFVPVQDLFLVGAATEHGWNNNANNAPLFRDHENQYLYYFTGYFTADGFKLLSSRGSWHPQYGSVSDGVLGVSDENGGNEPGQIMVPAAGYYQLTVNTQDMTYSLVPYDASSAPTFSSVGIIGDATPGGWGADTDLTNSAAQPHLWRVSSVALTELKVKFRANDSWDLPGNWGGGASPIQGVTSVNGGDFQGVYLPGNYEVWFNDLDGRYIFMEAE